MAKNLIVLSVAVLFSIATAVQAASPPAGLIVETSGSITPEVSPFSEVRHRHGVEPWRRREAGLRRLLQL